MCNVVIVRKLYSLIKVSLQVWLLFDVVLQLSDAFLAVVDDFLVVEDTLLLGGVSRVGLGSEDSLDDIVVPRGQFWVVEPDGPRSDDMRAVVVVTVALIMGADVAAVWDEP